MMDSSSLSRVTEAEWRLSPTGAMRVPVVIFATTGLLAEMEDKVLEQASNVACLPGIVEASYVMPDAHWGYGFPIGGVAAFDAAEGGIISAGGVGFDISCGVRTLLTWLRRAEIELVKHELADSLFRGIPSGLGSIGKMSLDDTEIDAMLVGGAHWAVAHGYGTTADLDRIEERGMMAGAQPDAVSAHAKKRQHAEMGTLGSGNHYLELQEVVAIHDNEAADAFGLKQGDMVLSIHCGSRGLGHQIGTEFLREMALAAPRYGLELPDLELACAPIFSELGQPISELCGRRSGGGTAVPRCASVHTA